MNPPFFIKNDKIIVFFDYAEGLKIKLQNGKTYFQIADENKVFQDANVIIKGNTIIVFSDEVKKPAAVRYAWSNFVRATLFNKDGLPASSFRTDDWSK